MGGLAEIGKSAARLFFVRVGRVWGCLGCLGARVGSTASLSFVGLLGWWDARSR